MPDPVICPGCGWSGTKQIESQRCNCGRWTYTMASLMGEPDDFPLGIHIQDLPAFLRSVLRLHDSKQQPVIDAAKRWAAARKYARDPHRLTAIEGYAQDLERSLNALDAEPNEGRDD